MDWNLVEKNIKDEIDFLKNNIQASPFNHDDPINCLDCLYRLIANLIVSGQIKIRKINYDNDSLWDKNNLILDKNNDKDHGQFWHSSKIRLIKRYLEKNNLDVKDESQLFYGRCDLGVPTLKTFIEVGTINPYKLYLNLSNMKDCRILLIISDDSLLEFIL